MGLEIYKIRIYYSDTFQTLDANGELDPTLLSFEEIDVYNVLEEKQREVEQQNNPNNYRSSSVASYYNYIVTTTEKNVNVECPQFSRILDNLDKKRFLYLGFATTSQYPNSNEFTVTNGYAFPIFISEETIEGSKEKLFILTLSKEINQLSI